MSHISRMCRHVDCHHPLVCLPRIPFQQWLAHVTRAKPFWRLTTTDYSHHCQLTDHYIVDQPCDCYQEKTCSEELPPPGVSCTVMWWNAKLYKNAFFKILICKNFKIWNIQIKDFQGPGIFFKIQRLSRTSQEPCPSTCRILYTSLVSIHPERHFVHGASTEASN